VWVWGKGQAGWKQWTRHPHSTLCLTPIHSRVAVAGEGEGEATEVEEGGEQQGLRVRVGGELARLVVGEVGEEEVQGGGEQRMRLHLLCLQPC